MDYEQFWETVPLYFETFQVPYDIMTRDHTDSQLAEHPEEMETILECLRYMALDAFKDNMDLKYKNPVPPGIQALTGNPVNDSY